MSGHNRYPKVQEERRMCCRGKHKQNLVVSALSANQYGLTLKIIFSQVTNQI